ncbi:MAG: aminotransferase class V-fold PLP-dependent enzyme [Holosporaceae bacterium]|jgi:cysteine desulfurase|nr:aminotransferase class V-fold PLP-dependent enzyme [Holosporaceae bacterium]
MKKFLALCLLAASAFATEDEVTYLDQASSYTASEEALQEFLKIARLDGNSSGLNSHAKLLKKIEKRASKIIANKINTHQRDVGSIFGSHAARAAVKQSSRSGSTLQAQSAYGAAGGDSVKGSNVTFVSSATVANNIAILGVAHKNPGCHLITSKIEHKSVLNVFRHLEKNRYKVTYLDVDRYGNVDLEQLRRSIRKDTKLISIQMLNSEIGALQDLKAIGKIAHQCGILFHTDAAQAFCKYDIDVVALHIDLLTIAGHKIGAPRGIAALYVRDPSQLQPILFGSGDELFPGSKPTELIAAFAVAVKNFHWDREQIKQNFEALITELTKIENIHLNTAQSSHMVSLSIEGVLLTDLLERLKNYSFSAGCSCTGSERSNVMEAIDPENKLPSCTIRVSFSDSVEPRQLKKFAQKLKIVVDQLRREKSVGNGCQTNVTLDPPMANVTFDPPIASPYLYHRMPSDLPKQILTKALKEKRRQPK